MSASRAATSESTLFPAGLVIDAQCSDPEQMREIAPYWTIEEEQLEPGRFHGSIAAFHTPRVQLAVSNRSHGTRVLGHVPKAAVAFALVLPSPHATYFQYRKLGPQEIAVAPAGEEFLFQTMGASRVVTVAVCERLVRAQADSLWRERLEARVADGRLTLAATITSGSVGRTLAKLVDVTLGQSHTLHDPTHCARLENSILRTLFASAEPSRPHEGRSNRRDMAVKAKAYLRAHANEPLRMGGLCHEMGRSSRTVEIGFREAFGMSLKARLQAMRLNGAHRDLRAARGSGTTVKEIAFKWGFMHLGRFSVNYRTWFGQCPSDTLRG